MFERLTDRARKVYVLANHEAQRLQHVHITPEHILLGFIIEGSGVGANILKKDLGIDLKSLKSVVESRLRPGSDVVISGKLPPSPETRKVTEYAIEEALSQNHNYAGTEHIILGLLRHEQGSAYGVLKEAGLNLEAVREKVLNHYRTDS